MELVLSDVAWICGDDPDKGVLETLLEGATSEWVTLSSKNLKVMHHGEISKESLGTEQLYYYCTGRVTFIWLNKTLEQWFPF